MALEVTLERRWEFGAGLLSDLMTIRILVGWSLSLRLSLVNNQKEGQVEGKALTVQWLMA